MADAIASAASSPAGQRADPRPPTGFLRTDRPTESVGQEDLDRFVGHVRTEGPPEGTPLVGRIDTIGGGTQPGTATGMAGADQDAPVRCGPGDPDQVAG